MRHLSAIALFAACAASIAPVAVSPVSAGGWHRWDGYTAPRTYAPRAYRAPRYDGGLRYYNSPRAYRSTCAYGDCACLHGMALRTGNPVWWDKYQACSGN